MRTNRSSHGAAQRRHLFASIALAIGGLAVALVIGELIVWWLRPTEYLYPRYEVSPQYGLIPFANVVMVHGVPRRFELRYSTNPDRSRGEDVVAAEDAAPHAVAVLGDSYTFGMGVSDGEEYPAVMRRELGSEWTVLNLASPGWGLTQQIRRYYDVGAAYDPEVVVLQFGGNDPEDNIINPVTRVRGGEFVYGESEHTLNWAKRMLSRSILQRSQLYNFVRVRASRLQHARQTRSSVPAAKTSVAGLIGSAPEQSAQPSPQEKIYVELLTTFADRLVRERRTLFLISVNRHLELFPYIQATVRELDASGKLHYEEVVDWLAGMSGYDSPDGGHSWGTRAHAVIGERLAGVVAAASAEKDPQTP